MFTKEQREELDVIINELKESFFDIVGRIDESYLGQVKLETYKKSLSFSKKHGFSNFFVYKEIRNNMTDKEDHDIRSEFTLIHQAVLFGISVLKAEIFSSEKVA